MNNQNSGALYSVGDNFMSRDLVSLHRNDRRSLFAVVAQSYHKDNEIHLIEYLSGEGTTVCHHVLLSSKFIQKMQLRSKSNQLFCLQNNKNGMAESSISFCNLDDIRLKNVTSKEEGYRVTSEALGSKNPRPLQGSSFSINFLAKEFSVSLEENKGMFLSNSRTQFTDISSGAPISEFKSLGKNLRNLVKDQKTNKYALSNDSDIIILDVRTSKNGKEAMRMENCHFEEISSLCFNPKRNNVLMSSSYEQTLKIWDLRRTDLPLFIMKELSSQIEDSTFNHKYDQLLLYSSSSGSIGLYLANSVSSTPSIDYDLNSTEAKDYQIKIYEGCLGDSVYKVAWGQSDPWVFGGVSLEGSVYFDVLPETMKYKIKL